MAGLFVKKGDTVLVRSGKDRGAQGKVLAALPDTQRVIVEGINRVKRHTRITTSQRGSQQGGIVTQEAALHVSNVQVVCPSCHKATRIGHRQSEPDDAGKVRSVRVCKRCNEVIG